jgi:cyclic pyranopterin phosphate synthase
MTMFLQYFLSMWDNNNDYITWYYMPSYEEITRLTAVFVSLGIDKIRITGGEPTVRPHIADLIQSISKISGVKSLSMTTNGLLLQENVLELKEAGLDTVNISLDTFRPDRFKSMCGIDGIERVLSSIKADCSST